MVRLISVWPGGVEILNGAGVRSVCVTTRGQTGCGSFCVRYRYPENLLLHALFSQTEISLTHKVGKAKVTVCERMGGVGHS